MNEMKDVFDECERCLYDIAKNIHRAYVQRYIRKKWITLAKDEYKIVTECHEWHLLDRNSNKISMERVIKILNKQSPTTLNHITRKYKLDKLPKNIQQISLINSPVITPIVNPIVNSVITPVVNPVVTPIVLQNFQLN